jgi:MATE family multidrug resistance protein
MSSIAVSGPRAVTHGRVLAIAAPMTLAYISTPLLGLADTTVIGRLGRADLLGAIAVGAVLFDVLFTTLNFLRSGTTGLTAQALGAGDAVEQRAVLLRALLVAAAAGLAIAALGRPLAELGLWAMGTSVEVSEAARSYLHIRLLSMPFALANYALLGWFVGLARAGTGLVLQVLLNGINLALNLWFVLGLGLGVAGIALGTVLAEAATALLGLLLAWRMGRGAPWPGLAVLRDRARFLALLALNRDIMIRSLALILALGFFTAQGARAGDTILAANAILLNFLMLGAFVLDGFATACEQLVGEALGARTKAALVRAVRLGFAWGVALAALASLAFWLGGFALIDLMTTAEPVRVLARDDLAYAALVPLVGAAAFLFDGVFIGATWSRDMRNSMLLALALYFLAWRVLAPALGNDGLWLALHLFLLARGVTLALRYRIRLAAAFPHPAMGSITARAAAPPNFPHPDR